MRLRLKEEASAPESEIAGMAVVTIRPEQIQLIGVKTGPVEKKPMRKTIRAVGRIDYNENGLSAVNLRFGGWVERLYVSATGGVVNAGDPLLAVYSPELLEAQRSYLLAVESAPGAAAGKGATPGAPPSAMEQGRQSARMRLLLLGFTEEQLAELEAKKEPQTAVTVHSKSQGVVVKRNVVAGSYLEPGKDLYELADLSTVWILADLYEFEIPLVKVGQEANIHLSALPGESFTGKVSFIHPVLNEATRTVRVRIETPNPDGRLKPAMYADVSIEVDLGERLVIDDQAILDTGTRQIVFVARGGGRFDPREVKIGTRSDGLAAVLEGLEEGETVVTSGNFLIDSESRIRAALSQGGSGAHQH